MSSEYTGIKFQNDVKEDLQTLANVFDFDYFYNGAGVGLCDLNNDGLLDVVFTANQSENRVYMNLGDFKFRDITTEAGINVKKSWSTGVSFVDINKDGFKDIYICQGGPHNAIARRNLLLINLGPDPSDPYKLSFEEKALDYGLADEGISTQASFFDYDSDGDLDCFVMNESLAFGTDPLTFNQLMLKQRAKYYSSFSHLYENRGGKYVDVSFEAGITQATYGLGLITADFNQDGLIDIYVANDYYLPDMMYINQGNGSFFNELKLRTNQISFYGMGADWADINDDGYEDLFVLDMASSDHYRSKTLMRSMNVENFRILVEDLDYHHQYMFNSLQINNGLGLFQNAAQLTKTAKTDWSWTVLMQDFNMDGEKDIFVSNGYRKYALDNDFQKEVFDAQYKYAGKVPLDVKTALYDKMPSEKLANIMFVNKGELNFEEDDMFMTENMASFSNGAAVGDLDNDGDPDLVVNNMDELAFVLRNTTLEKGSASFIYVNTSEESTKYISKVELHTSEGTQYATPMAIRGYMSSSEPAAMFGMSKTAEVDSLVIHWEDGFVESLTELSKDKRYLLTRDTLARLNKYNQSQSQFTCFPIDGFELGIKFKHVENKYDDFRLETLLPFKQSTLGPKLSTGDVNNDGLEDLCISNATGKPNYIYLQNERGFELFKEPMLIQEAKSEHHNIEISDINNDGLSDIILSAGGNEFVVGSDLLQSKILVQSKEGNYSAIDIGDTKGAASKTLSFDFDGDGDQDILVAGRIVPQKYPLHSSSYLFENDGGVFNDVTASKCPALIDFGIINDILTEDFNNDGLLDIVAVGEWTGIGFFKNTGSDFIDVSEEYGQNDNKGLWFSILSSDINNDGTPDFIVGNIGDNSKYGASKEKPLKIYGHDFDDSGTWDLVLSKSYKENYVPFRGRECSSQQMPFIETKFPSYDLFAKASIEDVYGENLEDAYYRYINNTSSIILLSDGKGNYNEIELPVEAQMFPILDILEVDYNNDGFKDYVVAGNIYNTEVETPRLDSGEGLILINTDSSKLEVVRAKDSGLFLYGNVKSLASIDHQGLGKKLIFCSENDEALKIYELTKSMD